jgi:hypothetical protein
MLSQLAVLLNVRIAGKIFDPVRIAVFTFQNRMALAPKQMPNLNMNRNAEIFVIGIN